MAKRRRSPKPKADPKSKRNASAPRARTSAWSWDVPLVAGLVVFTAAVACYKLTSTDLWWHLKTGQLIINEGAIPRVDPFRTGFVTTPQPYVDLHWGFQVVAYAVYSAAGAHGLVWMKVLAAVGVVALTLGIRVRGAPLWLHVAAWVPALFLVGGRLLVRPEIFTLLYLATFLLVLHHARSRHRWLWVLPVHW